MYMNHILLRADCLGPLQGLRRAWKTGRLVLSPRSFRGVKRRVKLVRMRASL